MFLFKNLVFAQANLIQNPSFEIFNNLHNISYEGKFEAYTPSLVHIVNDWNIVNSSDHYDSAFVTNGYNVPYAKFGNSYAKHGYAYAGFELYYTHPTIEVKEYIYQHLNSLLIADSTYCLSFFTTLADYSPLAVKNIGAFFSINPPSTSVWYISATPQVQNNSGFVTDTVNWQEIKGCFTAQGGEEYITIGNFNSNANTDTIPASPISPLTGAGNHIAYYYIDSITLWKNNFPTSIKENNIINSCNIYPNPNNGVFTIKSKDIIQKIEVTNIAGQLLLSELSSQKTHQLQLHNFSQGIYFIKVSHQNGLSITKKVIVNQ